MFGQTTAALILAAVDAVLAWILFAQGQRRTPTSEEAMVDELRALALAELANDTARLRAQLAHLQQQVTNIGEGISRVAHGDPLRFGYRVSVRSGDRVRLFNRTRRLGQADCRDHTTVIVLSQGRERAPARKGKKKVAKR
jgi:hypothetical protein